MPAHVHNPAHTALVVDHDRGVILHGIVMNRVREMAANPHGLPKEIVEKVDAVRGYVVERPASRLCRIDQPIALSLRTVKPGMAGEFGEYRFPDGSSFD